MSTDVIACSICGRVKAHRNDRPPYCRDCKAHANRLRLGDWHEQASCRDPQHDPEWWWADATDVVARAHALHVCWDCPVRPQCLAYAIEAEEHEGIWGGKTPDQRRRWHQARRVRSA